MPSIYEQCTQTLSNFVGAEKRIVYGATFDTCKMGVLAIYRIDLSEDENAAWRRNYKKEVFIVCNVNGALYKYSRELWDDDLGDDVEGNAWVTPVTMKQAIKLCEDYSASLLVEFFELPPEAQPLASEAGCE
jgi:hypothetical protein